MARYIHCPSCKDRVEKNAIKFGELYESIKGTSIIYPKMICDGNGEIINYGDACYAAVLLPNKEHFNYEKQKPESWMHEFIKVEDENIQ